MKVSPETLQARGLVTSGYAYDMWIVFKKGNNQSLFSMPQLLFQDRRDMKRASVELLPYYLVDFRRTLDAKTSLRLLDSETNI